MLLKKRPRPRRADVGECGGFLTWADVSGRGGFLTRADVGGRGGFLTRADVSGRGGFLTWADAFPKDGVSLYFIIVKWGKQGAEGKKASDGYDRKKGGGLLQPFPLGLLLSVWIPLRLRLRAQG